MMGFEDSFPEIDTTNNVSLTSNMSGQHANYTCSIWRPAEP